MSVQLESLESKLADARRYRDMAEDRQGRCDTAEHWLADQTAIARYESEISTLLVEIAKLKREEQHAQEV